MSSIKLLSIVLAFGFLVVGCSTTNTLISEPSSFGTESINELKDNGAANVIKDDFFAKLDGERVFTGEQIKEFLPVANSFDCAILINTISLTDATNDLWEDKGEVGKFTLYNLYNKPFMSDILTPAYPEDLEEERADNNLLISGSEAACPMVVLEGYDDMHPTSQIICVNYGTILKNAIQEDRITEDLYKAPFKYNEYVHRWEMAEPVNLDKEVKVYKYDEDAEYTQTVYYSSGVFISRQGFAVNENTGKALRYDGISDIDKDEAIMQIQDESTFKTYVLKDTEDNLIGIVLIQEY